MTAAPRAALKRSAATAFGAAQRLASFDGLLLGALSVSIVAYLFVLGASLNDPLLDWHGFRQTQTAISVYSMLHGGPWLFYETPVLGAPWRMPFEAPVFQISVALVSLGTPFGLDAAGRFTSFAYFIGAVIVGARLLAFLLPGDRRTPLIFALLLLASPQYLMWGRAFLIETCALFWCLLFLYSAMRFLRAPTAALFIVMLVSSLLGVLAKATTWPAAALAFAMFWLVEVLREKRAPVRTSAAVMLVGVLSLVAHFTWTGSADALKDQGALARFFASDELARHNFGDLGDRFGGELWTSILPRRMLPDALGDFWPATLIAPAFAARAHRRVAIAGATLFLAPILIFANLHMVHAYYQTANAIFLIAAAAALIAGAMARRRNVALAALTLIVIGQWYFFATERLPLIQRDMRNDPTLVAARAAKDLIPRDAALFAFAYHWTSEIHYYAERRGVSLPRGLPPEAAASLLADPRALLGDMPLGGAVDCRAAFERYSPAENAAIDAFLARLAADGARRTEAGGCTLYVADAKN